MKDIINLMLLFSLVGFISCDRDTEFTSVAVSGTISKQGITTYQYGTHIVSDDMGQTLYALRSDNENLDKYISKTVIIIGYVVKGYPISGGPEYLEVREIK